MTAPLDRVLRAFPDAQRHGKEWVACCPVHGDHQPSLNIREGDRGGVVLICRSRECAPERIVEAAGLTMADLAPPDTDGAPRIITTYAYHAADGTLAYQVVRFAPKDFRQRRPDPQARDG